METVAVKVVVDFRERSETKAEAIVETMSLGELLYWVMFGEGRVEAVRA